MKLSKETQSDIDQMDCDQNATTTNSSKDSIYNLGDFAYQSDSSLIIAFTKTDAQSPIQIFKVNISLNADYTGLEGNCVLLSTINLELHQTQHQAKKARISFASNDSADTLCVLLEVK